MDQTIKINENKDFLAAYKRGKYICGKACTFYFRKNGKKLNRIGITTSKKVGNAVMRNRARRIIRQAYRENEMNFPVGYDFVVVARDFAAECKSGYISNFFDKKVIPDMTKTVNKSKF